MKNDENGIKMGQMRNWYREGKYIMEVKYKPTNNTSFHRSF